MAEEISTIMPTELDAIFSTVTEDGNFLSPTAKLCRSIAFSFSTIILGLLTTAGLVTNVLAMIVLRKLGQNSEGAASVSLTLSVLAIADILFLITRGMVKLLPTAIPYLGNPTGLIAVMPWFYVWVWPLVTLTATTSLWVTVVLTIHRYIAVCHPHKASLWCTLKRTRVYLAVTILSVILFNLPVFFDDSLVKRTRDDNTTYMERVYTSLGLVEAYQLVYKTILYYAVMYAIPNLLLLIMTILLIRALIRSKKLRKMMKGVSQKSSESADDITKMLVSVVIVSLICNLYEPVRRILEFLNGGFSRCDTSFILYIFEQVAGLVPAVNASANFIIFSCSGKEFRTVLKKMCNCGGTTITESNSNSGMTASTSDGNTI